MNKIWLIVRKEWREVSRDKMILWTSLLLPLLFVGMTIGTVYFMQRTAASNPAAAMDDASEMNIDQLMLLPEFAGMDPFTIMIVLLVNQFLLYYLLLPLMIPMFVAVYSIIGEKQQRTLEPLLATPISVIELLTGKMLAGVIPATVLTWASYGVTILLAYFLTTPEILRVMLSPVWLLSIFLLAPLLSVTAVTVGVIISSRVNDVRLAEQLGGTLVLPLVAITIPIMMGKLLMNGEMILLASLAVALLDVALLYVGVQLFQRETILTRWK